MGGVVGHRLVAPFVGGPFGEHHAQQVESLAVEAVLDEAEATERTRGERGLGGDIREDL